MAQVYLFVYGQLKPGYSPPTTASMAFKDQVKGDLYDLGKDAALVNVGASKKWSSGYTMRIDVSELEKLDKEEAPQYNRVMTESYAGYDVFVYEYINLIPKTAKLVSDWKKP